MYSQAAQKRIFIFSWEAQASNLAWAVRYADWPEPVEIGVIPQDDISGAVDALRHPSVVGCVILLSPEALLDPALPQYLEKARDILMDRLEFRLFVFPEGFSDQEWDRLKARNEAVYALSDVVQLPERAGADATDIVAAIRLHLSSLPAIYNALHMRKVKRVAGAIANILNTAGALSVVFAVGFWVRFQREGLTHPWFPYMMVLNGLILFKAVFVLLTLGRPVAVPAYLRVLLAFGFPVWFVQNIPLPTILHTWPLWVAGFLIAGIIDNYRRLWVQNRKIFIHFSDDPEAIQQQLEKLPGVRYWNFLTNSAIFGVRSSVFISYARASAWGKQTALEIKRALSRLHIPVFLDLHDIPLGCSWYFQLQKALSQATVFISLQDETALSRPWVQAELATASTAQGYCGNPLLLIVREPGLSLKSSARAIFPVVNPVVFPERAVDPSLLQIIDYKDSTPVHIARGLLHYQQENSLFTPFLAQLIWLLLNALHSVLYLLGGVGGILAIPGGIYALYSSAAVPAWIQAHHLAFPLCLLLIFWAGFCLRYIFWLGYEQTDSRAKGCVFNFNGGTIFFLLLWWQWSQGMDLVQALYYFIGFNTGFLTAAGFCIKCPELPASQQSRRALPDSVAAGAKRSQPV